MRLEAARATGQSFGPIGTLDRLPPPERQALEIQLMWIDMDAGLWDVGHHGQSHDIKTIWNYVEGIKLADKRFMARLRALVEQEEREAYKTAFDFIELAEEALLNARAKIDAGLLALEAQQEELHELRKTNPGAGDFDAWQQHLLKDKAELYAKRRQIDDYGDFINDARGRMFGDDPLSAEDLEDIRRGTESITQTALDIGRFAGRAVRHGFDIATSAAELGARAAKSATNAAKNTNVRDRFQDLWNAAAQKAMPHRSQPTGPTP